MAYNINIYLRFALIALGIFGGIALSVAYGFWYGFLFILAGILLLVGYVLLGTVQSAATFLQTQDFDAAQKRLDLTFFPKFLYGPNRAYYHLLRGTIGMQKQEYDYAEAEYALAQKAGLPSDNEKAMILLQLANLRAQKGNWTAAQTYVRQLKELKVTEPQLRDQIKEFDKAISQRGQVQQMRGMNRGYMPGGKRPRPKMR
jgi:tetratricopeptide (TPR) repeat protein